MLKQYSKGIIHSLKKALNIHRDGSNALAHAKKKAKRAKEKAKRAKDRANARKKPHPKNPAKCPKECQAPIVKKGSKKNGGAPLLKGRKCTGRASKLYGKNRYCGRTGHKAYQGAGTVDCHVCGAFKKCSKQCQPPIVRKGSKKNGGEPLRNGKCTGRASKLYGKNRYCGSKGHKEYQGKGSVDCEPCAFTSKHGHAGRQSRHSARRRRKQPAAKRPSTSSRPSPSANREKRGHAPIVKNGGKCPKNCQAPIVKNGGKSNGGQKMTKNGKCTGWASKLYGEKRYCGHAGKPAYTGKGSVNCQICGAICPKDCRPPIVKPGTTTNGGEPLVTGKCLGRASKFYGKNRYCGHANHAAYNTKGSINCAVCKGSSSLLQRIGKSRPVRPQDRERSGKSSRVLTRRRPVLPRKPGRKKNPLKYARRQFAAAHPGYHIAVRSSKNMIKTKLNQKFASLYSKAIRYRSEAFVTGIRARKGKSEIPKWFGGSFGKSFLTVLRAMLQNRAPQVSDFGLNMAYTLGVKVMLKQIRKRTQRDCFVFVSEVFSTRSTGLCFLRPVGF